MRQILVVAALLFGLAYWPRYALAQGQLSWGAVLIEMSADGRYLAVKYGDYFAEDSSSGVWVYDLDTPLSQPQFLGEAHFYGTTMTFSPDSRRLTIARGSGLTIFSTRDYSQILEISNDSLEIPANFGMLSHSLDSNHIMSFSYRWRDDNAVMLVWEIDSGILVSSTPAPRSSQWVKHPWLSPDWRHYLDWSHARKVRIYDFDIDQGLGAHLVTISDDDERGAFFSLDSSLFALVKPAPESEIKIYRTDTWDLSYVQILGQHSCGGADVTLAFGHVKPWLVFWCNWDGRMLVWDLDTGELLFQTDAPSGRLQQLSQNDEMLVATELGYRPDESEITVWDSNKGFEMTIYAGKNPQLYPDGEQMAAIGPDGRVWIWNIKSKELIEVLPLPQRQSS